MPEILEIERYRCGAEAAIGRVIHEVETPDEWYLKRGTSASELAAMLAGSTVVGCGRRGKLLLLNLRQAAKAPVSATGSAASRERAAGPAVAALDPRDCRSDYYTLGLRFGMTGRLVVDGHVVIGELEYGSSRRDPQWTRFRLLFSSGGSLEIDDPRRLGGVEFDPDLEGLGPDALTLTLAELRKALAGSRGPLKARLLDQSCIAGIGNLLADDIAWRGRLDPKHPVQELDAAQLARLHRAIRTSLRVLGGRGGSHTGDLQSERHRAGSCPRCALPLHRETVGGRTTYSCSNCQR